MRSIRDIHAKNARGSQLNDDVTLPEIEGAEKKYTSGQEMSRLDSQ